jgi:ribonuclease HI
MENIKKDYTGRNIYILSDSQVAITALGNFQINSKLTWDCHQSTTKLAEINRIKLVWLPGHTGIDGNETADQLAKQAPPIIGPQPAYGTPAKVAKEMIRN